MDDLIVLAAVAIALGVLMAGISNRTSDRVRQAKKSRSADSRQVLSFSLENKIRKSS